MDCDACAAFARTPQWKQGREGWGGGGESGRSYGGRSGSGGGGLQIVLEGGRDLDEIRVSAVEGDGDGDDCRDRRGRGDTHDAPRRKRQGTRAVRAKAAAHIGGIDGENVEAAAIDGDGGAAKGGSAHGLESMHLARLLIVDETRVEVEQVLAIQRECELPRSRGGRACRVDDDLGVVDRDGCCEVGGIVRVVAPTHAHPRGANPREGVEALTLDRDATPAAHQATRRYESNRGARLRVVGPVERWRDEVDPIERELDRGRHPSARSRVRALRSAVRSTEGVGRRGADGGGGAERARHCEGAAGPSAARIGTRGAPAREGVESGAAEGHTRAAHVRTRAYRPQRYQRRRLHKVSEFDSVGVEVLTIEGDLDLTEDGGLARR